jgi:hypothetical protein
VVCYKKNGSKLRLKIQGNIKEQPMDVKELVVLHLGNIIKFSRQDAKAKKNRGTLVPLAEIIFFVNPDMHNYFDAILPKPASILLNPLKSVIELLSFIQKPNYRSGYISNMNLIDHLSY